MTRQRAVVVVGSVLLATGVTWALAVVVPRLLKTSVTSPPGAAAGAVTASAPVGRKISAQLFYVAEDGLRLTTVEREVAYAEQPSDQAREILNAQIAPVAAPLVSAIPAGTTLRAVFVTPQGEAFVDLSVDVSTAHPGGSLNELLTIYTIVHALTFNLPAITAVQLLVDGKEVDTLAGHVDLRGPLSRNVDFTVDSQ